jgi:hypothetical protein
MKIDKNIWKNISMSSKKRCLNGPPIYWFVDEFGAYCLRFENVNNNQIKLSDIDLEGIKIEYIDIPQNLIINLKLINNNNYEIFYYLCCDVIDALSNKGELQSSDIKKRLLKWVELLKKKSNRELSIGKQMGIYSELHTILNFLPHKMSLENAILSWRGPDMDKQDFDLGDSLLEIKSYSATKKQSISISSIEQLDVSHTSLYLFIYELSLNEQGENIKELINRFSEKIDKLSYHTQSMLFTKLYSLGYQNEHDAPQKFKVISNELFKVEENFPKICRNNVSNAITNVKYDIDIEQINEFKIIKEEYFK